MRSFEKREGHDITRLELEVFLGTACLLSTVRGDGGVTYGDAERHLTQAITGLRNAGIQYCLPVAYLSRAELHRRREELDAALNDLAAADRIAARYGELLKCDVLLESCRLLLAAHDAHTQLDYGKLAQDGTSAALESIGEPLALTRTRLENAKTIVATKGYHRRAPEILLVTAHLQILEERKDAAKETLAEAKKLIDSMGCHRWDTDLKALREKLGR
jgi:hypothetical protein